MENSTKRQYNLYNIRVLLTRGFNAEELRQFCHDTPRFQPVYDKLAQETGKDKIIERLIEYARQQVELETLLIWAKTDNPKGYEQYQPYYKITDDCLESTDPKDDKSQSSADTSLDLKNNSDDLDGENQDVELQFVRSKNSKPDSTRVDQEKPQTKNFSIERSSLYFLLFLSFCLGGVIGLFVKDDLARSSLVTTWLCGEYSLQIKSPTTGEKVPQFLRVTGDYWGKPGGIHAWIFQVEKVNKVMHYRPKSPIVFNEQDMTWYSDVNFLGESNSIVNIAVFLVGKDGEMLINYHLEAGKETNYWPPFLELPDDIVECSSVGVAIE